jgi:hypothetical protein
MGSGQRLRSILRKTADSLRRSSALSEPSTLPTPSSWAASTERQTLRLPDRAEDAPLTLTRDLIPGPEIFASAAVEQLGPQQVTSHVGSDEQQATVRVEPIEIAAWLVVGERRPELALDDDARDAIVPADDIGAAGGVHVVLLVAVLELARELRTGRRG